MKLNVLNLVVPVVTSRVSGILAFASAKNQSKSEIDKLNVIHKTEIEKVKMQQKFEMD